MFKIFGEFDTFEEINEAAAGLKAEGDMENIVVLAKENGIDEEIAKLYISGELDFICDLETAAIGKLDVEAAELGVTEIVADWTEYVKSCAIKDQNMARAIRKKEKSLKSCISKLLAWSFKNMYPVDKEILKLANVTQSCKMGIPSMRKAKELIKEYYLGK